MLYEIQMWILSFLKLIPGNIGCAVRNTFLPYKHGKGVTIWDHTHIDSPSKLTLGNNVSINRGCVLHAGGGITMGNDVLIGPNVTIYSQNHNFDSNDIPIYKQGYTLNEVIIGNNVWIASNATILPGVSIGDNVVVGANTLVNKNIENGSLVVGNPCRIIKRKKD